MARRKQPEGSKPYLSPSQLGTPCGEQYRRIYIEKERLAPGIEAARGSAVHAAASVNFKQKMRTGRDISVADFKGIAAEEFAAQVAGGVSVGHDVGNISVAIGAEKDLAVDMAEVHAREQAPDYRQPVYVEEMFRIELPGKFDALGIIDLADADARVADFKTSRRKKKQSDADNSLQLTMYAAGHLQLTGKPVAEARLDVLAASKTKVERQVLSTDRGPADYDALAARINALARAIEAGVFLPVEPGHWVCSPKWCGFYSSCKFVNAERRAKTPEGE